MEQNENKKHPNNDSYQKQFGIMLPCEPRYFCTFLSGLLGKPQTIEKGFALTYELTRDEVINLYHLVDQRIHQQNDANLIQFTVKIFYSDDSSVLLNSLEDFTLYKEIRPIISIGVALTWIYLIRFQQKQATEKQQIELTFRSNIDSSDRIIEDDIIIRSITRCYHRSEIVLKIDHTDRTWGTDIESLLTGHIKTLQIQETKIKKFICKKSGYIGLFTAVLFILGSVVGAFISTNKFINIYLKEIANIGNKAVNQSELLLNKIDYLISITTKGIWPRYIFSVIIFLVTSLIVSIILGIWVGTKADNKPRSYVLLSKKAIDQKNINNNKTKRDWLLFSISIFISIIAGLVSNYIFAVFFSQPK
jgi:hypothetical protein